MAKIPGETAFGARPTPSGGRAIGQVRANTSGFDALNRTVQTLDNRRRVQEMRDAAKREADQQRLQGAKARSTLLQGKVIADSKYDDDNDYGTYEERYNQDFDKIAEEASSLITDPTQRALFDEEVNIQRTSGVARIQAKARAKEVQVGRASLTSSIEANLDAFVNADPATRISLIETTNDQIDDSAELGFLSPAEAEKMRRTTGERFVVNKLKSLTPADQVAFIENDPSAQFLSESAKAAFLQESARAELEQQAAAKMAKSQAASDLEIGVSRETVGYQEIDQAFESQVITGAKRTQLYAQLDKKNGERALQAAGTEQVANALETGPAIDPGNKHAVKAYNAMVDSVFPDLTLVDDAGLTNLAQVVEKVGLIPDSVKTYSTRHLRSGDPVMAVQGADIIARMPDRLVNDFSAEDRAVAELVNDSVAAGMDPVLAVETSRQRVYETNDAERKRRASEYNAKHRKKNTRVLKSVMDDRFGQPFIPEPEPPVAMQAEYDILVEQYHTVSDDIDSARKMAGQDLLGVWGETSVNGKREMMKYAPEVVYGLPDDEVVRQLKAEVGGDAPIRLVADSITARSAQPSYMVMVPTDMGINEPLLGEDNFPVRWRPDPTEYQAELARQSKADAEASLNEARILRDVNETIKTLPGLGAIP